MQRQLILLGSLLAFSVPSPALLDPTGAAAAPESALEPGASDEWPHWRGAGFHDAGAPPADAGEELVPRVAWRRSIGTGYAAIAVASGRVVTMGSDEGADWVLALDAERGAELWRTRIAPAFPGHDGAVDGPVSTPAIADGRVFAVGPRGDLLALDLETGERVWSRHLVEDFGAEPPHWGFTTSPLVHGGLVVVMTGGDDGAFTALDTASGEVVWRAGHGTVEYQSPLVLELAGREQLLGASDTTLFGLEPSTGAVLWTHDFFGAGFYARILNPTILPGDRLLLKHRDTLSKAIHVGAVDEGGGPDSFVVTDLWSSRHLRLNYNTAIHHEGHVYGHGSRYVTCIDAASGELRWRSREPGNGWLARAGDRLVVLTKQGVLALVATDPEAYREEARIQLFERETWTPPAVAYGRVYARDSFGDLACVELVPRDVTPELVDAGVADAELLAAVEAGASFPRVERERFVRFVVRSDAADVGIRCDLLGAVDEQPLRRVGETNVFTTVLEAEPDARFAYLFVEDFEKNVLDGGNPGRDSGLFGTAYSRFDMPRASHQAPSLEPPAGDELPLLGRLDTHDFEALERDAGGIAWSGSRPVSVYLPPHYFDGDERFPVVYFQYGGQMLDVLRVPQRVERWFDEDLPPFIGVFVPSRSAYEYARSHREAYRGLLVEEIVPWIDAIYRTRASADGRSLVGIDEGGYASFWIAGHHPDVFGGAASQSMWAVCSRDANALGDLLRSAASLPTRAYLDWGAYDTTKPIVGTSVAGESRRVAELLRARGVEVTVRATNDGGFAGVWAERLQGLLAAMLEG